MLPFWYTDDVLEAGRKNSRITLLSISEDWKSVFMKLAQISLSNPLSCAFHKKHINHISNKVSRMNAKTCIHV